MSKSFTKEELLYLTPREYCPEYYDELKRQVNEEKIFNELYLDNYNDYAIKNRREEHIRTQVKKERRFRETFLDGEFEPRYWYWASMYDIMFG